jgi:hypothetical protein
MLFSNSKLGKEFNLFDIKLLCCSTLQLHRWLHFVVSFYSFDTFYYVVFRFTPPLVIYMYFLLWICNFFAVNFSDVHNNHKTSINQCLYFCVCLRLEPRGQGMYSGGTVLFLKNVGNMGNETQHPIQSAQRF